MNRQAGWYWIKEPAFSPKWEAAEWVPEFNAWSVTANEEWVRDENLVEVGPRIPTPDEPFAVVLLDSLRELRSSISGDAYRGEEWEKFQIDEMLKAAPSPGQEG